MPASDGFSFLLPWGAWREDTERRFELPASWQLEWMAPRDLPALTEAEIDAAIDRPIDQPNLASLARGRRSAAIAIDDLARPTPGAELLPPILRRLSDGGLPTAAVTIVVANGTHEKPTAADLRLKLGPSIVDRYRVVCHDAEAELADTGIPYGQSTLRIQADFAAAELKLAVGAVLPHPFAGYSGGAKLLLPGLADFASTARAHKFVQLGLRGGFDAERNQFRREAESIARQVGLHFIVTAVCTPRRQLGGVFAGDVAGAHRRACTQLQQHFHVPLRTTPDVLWLNAYPKDIDLWQSAAALVSLRRLSSPPVSADGVVVLSTACRGTSRHGLFSDEVVATGPKQPLRTLAGRPLWIFAPGLTPEGASGAFWSGYPVFDRWETLRAALTARFPQAARVAVLPVAPMQELIDERAA